VTFISAVTGEGINELLGKVVGVLGSLRNQKDEEKAPERVLTPGPRHAELNVRKEGETFVVSAPEMERLVEGTDISGYESRRQLQKELEKRGLRRALEKAGAKPGDRIKCGKLEWEF
ncbi:MAG: Obg family GTPase CgtA, partial [Chloroflexi bacterium]|nr:Obg family GTPase CgtA [Chloroflexota bacterium]